MPYKKNQPTLFFEHQGVSIYHSHKDDDVNQVWTYWYTTDCDEDEKFEFDVRELPVPAGITNDDHKAIISSAIERQLIKIPACTNQPSQADAELRGVIEILERVTNNMSFDYAGAARIMAVNFTRTHRTLQQSIIHLMHAFLCEAAKLDCDLRNEAAIEWCKKVAQIDAYFPFI